MLKTHKVTILGHCLDLTLFLGLKNLYRGNFQLMI